MAWYADMVGGSFLVPLVNTWRLLSDKRRLHQAGFITSATEAAAAGAPLTTESTGLLEDEQRWVMWLVGLLSALTRNRLRHLLAYTSGPFLFAALVAQDPHPWCSTRLGDCGAFGRAGRPWLS